MFRFKGPVIFKKSLRSTNDYLLEQVSAGLITLEGTVVTAYSQTHGKGLDNSSWESEPGKNLTFSILLKPSFLRAHQQFCLNKVISLAVMDFVRKHIEGHKIRIKWPNDVYIDNGKVAGILINNTISGTRMMYSVAGIGININQIRFSGIAANPVSVIQFTGEVLDRNFCLEEILQCIADRYFELSRGNQRQINSDYLASLYRINELHLFRYKDQTVTAEITGISEFGHLQLTLGENQKIECDFKEIIFL